MSSGCFSYPPDLDRAQRGTRLAVVGDFLSLGDLAQLAVVEYEISDAQPQGDGRCCLQAGHQERSVAYDAHHLPVGVGKLGPDGRRHGVAHGVEVCGRDEGARGAYLEKLSGKKSVVAVVYGHDGVIEQPRSQLFKEQRRIYAVALVSVPLFAVGVLVAFNTAFNLAA